KGVLYVDRQTKHSKEVYARAVVLGASAMESTRILLNAKNRQHPNGLANSGGVLGHYYTDSLKGGNARGMLPNPGAKLSLNRPHRPTGVYVARFRNVPGTPKMKSFLRGYGLQGENDIDFNAAAPGFG